ncbi:VWA domain-containing protein [bacterium]|nr:VWA domain-containing protein [bacterium]
MDAIRTMLLAGMLFLLSSSAAHAQIQLVLGDPDFSDYPSIAIPFELLDNTATLDSVGAENLILFENGVRMFPLTVDCGDLKGAQKVNFFFLMDVSYSMAFKEGTYEKDPDSVKWRTAKNVFSEGFKKLRAVDVGALASFAGDFWMEQSFTTDKTSLADAAAGMYLRAGTAIYDAIVTASGYLEDQEGKRVIVILTDGVDNRSRHTREQAINISWSRGVPVYPIGLGFYRDPTDPFRQDVDTLTRIAEGTGGKAFFAPTSEELEAIFSTIIESIYTIGCVVRYTSPDTCRNGSERKVELQAEVKGMVASEEYSYTLPDLRSRLSLSYAFPGSSISSGERYDIPIMGDGELRAGEPTDFDIDVTYDPALVQISGLSNINSVFDPANLQLTDMGNGHKRISARGAVPRRGISYNSPDAVVALDMQVLQRFNIDTTYFGLDVGPVQQICEVLPDAEGSTMLLAGCPSSIVLGFDTTIVAAPGSIVTVPLVLDATLDPVQLLSYDLQLEYDGSVFTYVDYLIERTLSAKLDVSVTPMGDALHIAAGPGVPQVDEHPLIILRFRAAELKEAQEVSFKVESATLQQFAPGLGIDACTPLIQLYGARVFADGICKPLLRRRAGPILEASRPNPISGSNPNCDLAFSITEASDVFLEIVDEFGRSQAVLVDGYYDAGRYETAWRPQQLASGIYLAVLRSRGVVRTQKIVVTR